MGNGNFSLILEEARMITPFMRYLRFKLEQERKLDFIPGQYLTFHLQHGDQKFQRHYSIANIYTGGTHYFEFVISKTTDTWVNQQLYNLSVGDKIFASGPHGDFILANENSQRYLLAATGTGVIPFRSMRLELEKRLTQQQNLKIILLLGVRKSSDLIYADEFIQLNLRNPRFEFKIYYSDFSPVFLNAYEYHGKVSEGIKLLDLEPQQDIAYLCGNPAMIKEIYLLLLKHNFSEQQIRYESYYTAHVKELISVKA